MNATLALEDGTWYRGVSAGAPGETSGEVVFNTSMTGYQEVLTDPSYAGQIVTMTAPLIGNYGTAAGDAESQAPRVAGFIVREASPVASNWRADSSLRDYLVRHDIVAIADIDTRALTRVLRSAGVMRGVIATGQVDPDELVARARAIPKMEGSDLVRGVTCDVPFDWRERAAGAGEADHREFGIAPQRRSSRRLRVAAYDYGIKWNILRRLDAYGCDVRVFPATAPPSELLAIEPDGLFLSNGPGDPAALPYAINNVRELVSTDIPTFGICLGHQMLGLAVGAKTRKMHQGHHGANHPVKDETTGKVEITSMNHGFAVDQATLPKGATQTHISLFDGSNCGIALDGKPVFSVQYHPEASPGPRDSRYLFRRFVTMMAERRS